MSLLQVQGDASESENDSRVRCQQQADQAQEPRAKAITTWIENLASCGVPDRDIVSVVDTAATMCRRHSDEPKVSYGTHKHSLRWPSVVSAAKG